MLKEIGSAVVEGGGGGAGVGSGRGSGYASTRMEGEKKRERTIKEIVALGDSGGLETVLDVEEPVVPVRVQGEQRRGKEWRWKMERKGTF